MEFYRKISGNKMSLSIEKSITDTTTFIEKELPRYINQQMTTLSFSQTQGFKIHVDLKGKDTFDYLSFAKNFLQNL